MKKLSRRHFLQTLGIGASVVALQGLPGVTAFADNELVEIDPDSFISEMNSWYQGQGLSLTLDSIETNRNWFTSEEIEEMVSQLQSIRIVKESDNSISSNLQTNTDISTHEIMPVNFSKTVRHHMSAFITSGIYGNLTASVTISGTYDALRENFISSSGSVIEESSKNLSSVTFGTVSLSRNVPSTLDISYSVPCDVYFEYTDPNTNNKYRLHDTDTFEGYISC